MGGPAGNNHLHSHFCQKWKDTEDFTTCELLLKPLICISSLKPENVCLYSKMGGNDIYLITAFVGHDASPEEIAALEEQVAQICPDAEFYTVDGGQDVYPFIFVVE